MPRLATWTIAFLLAAPVAQADDPPAPEWLAVIQGTVDVASEGKLTLSPDPTVVVFTDRPERKVGFMAIETYVASAWGADAAFEADPPNASVVLDGRLDQGVSVYEISAMAWNSGEVEIAYRILEGAAPAPGERFVATIDTDYDLHVDNHSNDSGGGPVVFGKP
ncbi:MAG: hypothetical protein KDJ86_14930 [Bauldia sp.]|uniref:hypothetical protein n=1 Tax=Bauldia sp. TaxID=2575872 RepID=UPI001DE41258|nr:hypothetical protein [Bauldia sp.]MCB1497080.1 hypothetical protein [Bauldia sp.]